MGQMNYQKPNRQNRNVLKNGQRVMRIAFLTRDRKYINIVTDNLDFSDLQNGEDLMFWLRKTYLGNTIEGDEIEGFSWGTTSFAEEAPYRYQEYVLYTFHGDILNQL